MAVYLDLNILSALRSVATPQICLRIAAKSGGSSTAAHAQARAAFLVLLRVHPFAMLRCLSSRPQRQGEQTAVPRRVDGGWSRAGPSAFLCLSFLQVSVACPASKSISVWNNLFLMPSSGELEHFDPPVPWSKTTYFGSNKYIQPTIEIDFCRKYVSWYRCFIFWSGIFFLIPHSFVYTFRFGLHF